MTVPFEDILAFKGGTTAREWWEIYLQTRRRSITTQTKPTRQSETITSELMNSEIRMDKKRTRLNPKVHSSGYQSILSYLLISWIKQNRRNQKCNSPRDTGATSFKSDLGGAEPVGRSFLQMRCILRVASIQRPVKASHTGDRGTTWTPAGYDSGTFRMLLAALKDKAGAAGSTEMAAGCFIRSVNIRDGRADLHRRPDAEVVGVDW
ncbi:hypothetical protein B0H11DRAFT_1909141 [Mycena galericulata]|nr:hypothetical protein B0H11DRAFT_1909141 [Mycena galericulata]